MSQDRQIRAKLAARCGWHSRLRGDRGGTLVETAFSIAILMALVIGIMEVALTIYSYHFISNAARQGTRYAIVRGDTWTQPPWSYTGTCASYTDAGCVATDQNIEDYVKSLTFPGIDASKITVTPAWYSFPGGTADPANNAAGDWVQVTVAYKFPTFVPFIPSRLLTMSSTSSMVITQ